MVSNRQEQIEIFKRRLKETLSFKRTFDELLSEGLISLSFKFFDKNINRIVVELEKRKQVELFSRDLVKTNSFNESFDKLKKEGKITFGISFFRSNTYIDPKKAIKEGKMQQAQMVMNHLKINNITKKQAYKELNEKNLLTFAFRTLLVAIREIEDQKITKDYLCKNKQDTQSIKIVKEWEQNYFEGRIMTEKVKNAYKLLKL